MERRVLNNKLFQASHLIILISYTVMSVLLAFGVILFGWEKWALILVVIGVAVSWFLHIHKFFTDSGRLWIYATLMMASFFFYGIHPTTMYDLAPVMMVVIILSTMTGIKGLIYDCQFTYYITMGYDIFYRFYNGGKLSTEFIITIVLHLVLITMAAIFSRIIVEKWAQMTDETLDDIDALMDSASRLDDFLANASHEIRTPVNAVIGLTGVCLDRENSEEEKRDLQAIRRAGQRVADQMKDILDYSEIDSGRLTMTEENYMLSSLLSDTVAELRPHLAPEIELVLDVDPAIPSVMKGDISKIKRVMWHLIMNGLKYTREGGVYVRVTSEKRDYGVNLCIDVVDTGIGMKPEESRRIFERFYQADSGRSRVSGGLGLGMPIVNGFVHAMGGFLTISSEVGKGTSVHVCLPQKVVDPSSCLSVNNREKVSLGAFFYFNKYPIPEVREFYNNMITNVVKGMGVQLHGVDSIENLKKVVSNVRLSHIFIGMKEYETDIDYIEEVAKSIPVYITANPDYRLPEGSRVHFLEKPLYCFPIIRAINAGISVDDYLGKMFCRGVKALVVDDEPMNIIVAKGVLGGYGITIETAESGPESIDMCLNGDYDVVFMDHMMPGMDGIEAMKKIRSVMAGRRNVPIVALTANTVSSAREMFIREGFDGFVGKPIDVSELERVLRKVLPPSKVTFEDVPVPAEREDIARPEPVLQQKPEQKPEHKPKEAKAGNQEVPNTIVSGENLPKEETASHERAYDFLRTMDVDPKVGLGYCQGDDELYRGILLDFASKALDTREYMDDRLEEGKLAEYEVKIHSVKSTARMIGASKLADMAQELETAADEGRMEDIRGPHEDAMRMYTKLAYGIKSALDG